MKSSVTTWIVCVALSLNFCVAQFPRRCSDFLSLSQRECCPVGLDGTKCNEASGKGSCQPVKAAATNLSIAETRLYLFDERARWPSALYDRACFCKDNFDGVDCSGCRAGFDGQRCSERRPVVIRRNLTSLSTEELQNFIDILDRSKRTLCENYVILTTSFDRILLGETPQFANVSVYNLFVWMHAHVSRDNLLFEDQRVLENLTANDLDLDTRLKMIEALLNRNASFNVKIDVDYGHEGSAFIPWHRYFMLKWEAELRDTVAKDPNFALPYWDWKDAEECSVCNDAMMGGRNFENSSLISPASPFSKWKLICTRGDDYILNGQQCTGEPEGPLLRNPGSYDPLKIDGLPRAREVDDVLLLGDVYDTPTFDISANQSYRNLLEGFARTDNGVADPVRSYMHNAVHLFMNGTMSSVDTSANDPIFVIHHSFVDSLFELWLRKRQRENKRDIFNTSAEPRLGHRPQDYMVPFFPLVQNQQGFTGTKELGYAYDYIEMMDESSASDLAGKDDEMEDAENSAYPIDETNTTSIDNLTAASEADLLMQVTVSTAPINAGKVAEGIALSSQSDPDVSSEMSVIDVDSRKANATRGNPAIGNNTPNTIANIPGAFHFPHSHKALQKRPFSKVPRRRFRLRKRFRSSGEGGFSLNENMNNVLSAPPVLADSARLVGADSNAAVTETGSSQSGLNWWQKVKNFFAEAMSSFKSMSSSDAILLMLFCFLFLLIVYLCYCACRSNRLKKKGGSNCYKRVCCCGYSGSQEESVTLLEKREDGLLKSKVVKGTSYF